MKSQAYFHNIQKEIAEELNKSTVSIHVAMAWLTDPKLFKILCQKAKENIDVEILIANNNINFDSNINYYELKQNGGQLHWIGKNFQYAPLMHNKFCIIDDRVLIFGSYNWTRKAKSNHESITIIEDDKNLILDFSQEFQNIKNKYLKEDDINLDWNKITIRLDTLLNTIHLEDEEDIAYQVKKLSSIVKNKKDQNNLARIFEIIECCSKNNYANAVSKIQQITAQHKRLTLYKDPEIPAIKLEIKSLQFQVTSLEDEKTDIEKLIHTFSIRYNKELGEIINEILLLKRKIAQNKFQQDTSDEKAKKDFDEAKQNYEEFNESFKEKMKEELPTELSPQKQKELKQLYREATKLCHPDKVAEEQKEIAQKVFTELKEAYDQNDLQTIQKILKDIQKGVFRARGESITEKDKLLIILQDLKLKRAGLEKNILALEETETFQKIEKIKDWNSYFEDAKNDYLNILNDLRTLQNNKVNA